MSEAVVKGKPLMGTYDLRYAEETTKRIAIQDSISITGTAGAKVVRIRAVVPPGLAHERTPSLVEGYSTSSGTRPGPKVTVRSESIL